MAITPQDRHVAATPVHGQVEVVEGVRLHTIEWGAGGDGTPFLLVHGLASNAELWAGMGPLLAAAGHPTIAVDQRGHGLSTRTDDGYDHATLTGDLVGVLDAHGIDRAVVVGQSWGGNVVLELGLRHPDRVVGVVGVDGGTIELRERFDDWDACRAALTPPRLDGRSRAEIEAMMRRGMDGWPESGIRGQLANLHRRRDGTVTPNLTLDRHLAILAGLWAHRPSERFAELTVPLLLCPVRGGMTSEAVVARALELAPRAAVHWFDGHHDVHAQSPAEVSEVLLAALADGVLAS